MRILGPLENLDITHYAADAVNFGTEFSTIQLPGPSGPNSPHLKDVHIEEGNQSSFTVAVRVHPFNQW